MAISIEELINKKEQIEAKKQETFDLETSIGTITVKKVTAAQFLEAMELDKGLADKYIILQQTVAPNLKDTTLQQAYGCTEPTDIVTALFEPGEIPAISVAIGKCAGYGKDIKVTVHDTAKN